MMIRISDDKKHCKWGTDSSCPARTRTHEDRSMRQLCSV
jgi:hypothetical protein